MCVKNREKKKNIDDLKCFDKTQFQKILVIH